MPQELALTPLTSLIVNEVRMVTAEYIQKEIQKSHYALGFETL
jgi:hypothetical protein